MKLTSKEKSDLRKDVWSKLEAMDGFNDLHPMGKKIIAMSLEWSVRTALWASK